MITAGQFRKWMQLFKVLTGSNRSVDTAYSGHVGLLNSTPTPGVVNPATFYPITASLQSIDALNFTNELFTYDGVSTPSMLYTGEATQQVEINWNLVVRNAVAGTFNYEFNLCRISASNVVTITNYHTAVQCSGTTEPLAASVTGILELATGDRVILLFKNLDAANSVIVKYYSATATSSWHSQHGRLRYRVQR
jgi:hypothetical protein